MFLEKGRCTTEDFNALQKAQAVHLTKRFSNILFGFLFSLTISLFNILFLFVLEKRNL